MHLGAYNACLDDKPLGEALDVIASLGLTSAEINSGGFLPAHPPAGRRAPRQRGRAEAYLAEFSSRGLTLTALNCNGTRCTRQRASPTRRTSSTRLSSPPCSA